MRVILTEQAAQPGAERRDVLSEPVKGNVGLRQLFACLLAGREQKDQRGYESALGGYDDSVPGAKASVESRWGG